MSCYLLFKEPMKYLVPRGSGRPHYLNDPFTKKHERRGRKFLSLFHSFKYPRKNMHIYKQFVYEVNSSRLFSKSCQKSPHGNGRPRTVQFTQVGKAANISSELYTQYLRHSTNFFTNRSRPARSRYFKKNILTWQSGEGCKKQSETCSSA